jgi:hypothetical protein
MAAALFAIFATYAAVFALGAHGAESVWGAWAAGGYGAAATVAVWSWRRHPSVSLLPAQPSALWQNIVAYPVLRPPCDVQQASVRLAIGLAAMFLLAPDARVGYFAYPVGIVSWLILTVVHPRRA